MKRIWRNEPARAERLERRVMLAGNGSGLQGAYFNGDNFDVFVGNHNDPQVNFVWGTGAPTAPAGVNTDHFTVRWTGKVEALASEAYTFYAKVDDGVRLWVNNQLLIDKWIRNNTEYASAPVTLVAGQKYDIKMEYWEESSGATAQLLWSSPSQTKAFIPTTQLYLPLGTGTGLRGDYYNNTADGTNWNDLVTTQTNSTINFLWGTGSPAAGVGADFFSTRWVGRVEALSNEAYTFYAKADDGVRLWVNNQLLIDKWIRNNAEYTSAPITLVSGQKYEIRMDYFESGSGATAQLSWSTPTMTKAIVPMDRLYANASPTAALTSPTSGQTIPVGSPVTLSSSVSDSDGTISKVEYYEGVTKIGESLASPWQFTWSNPATGGHSVYARAIDNRGGATDSSAVSFTVATLVGTGTGLNAAYYNGTNFNTLRATTVDSTVNFVRTVSGPWPPAGVQYDNWSARWTGQVQPRYSETYTFTITSDDGSRLWVDGKQIINDWTAHGARPTTGSITLTAGQKYDFVLEYFNGSGEASIKLEWASASQPMQVVPQLQLYPTAGINIPPAVVLTSPVDLSSFTEPSTLVITANATDSTGITKVEFYSNGSLINTDTTAPYGYNWSGRTDGKYVLTARAYDTAGAWSDAPLITSHVYKIMPGPTKFIIGVWAQPARNPEYSPARTPLDWKNLGINTMLGYDWGGGHDKYLDDWITTVASTGGMDTIRQWRNGWISGQSYIAGDIVQRGDELVDITKPTGDRQDAHWISLAPHVASSATEPGVGASWQQYWAKSPAPEKRIHTYQNVTLANDKIDPNLLAWMQSDEPDLNDSPSPSDILLNYQMLHRIDPARPVYLNFAGPRLNISTRKSVYLDYLHAADWIGQDSYPINNNGSLLDNATRDDLLDQYSAGKPHFTFIEASWQHLKQGTTTIGRCPTAYEMRAEIWLAVIHGAKGIFYFPQRVDSTFRYDYIPNDSRTPDVMNAPSGGPEFDVRAMVGAQNAQLAAESNWLVNFTSGSVLSGLPAGLQGIVRTYGGVTKQYILNLTTSPITYNGKTYGKYEMLIAQGAPMAPMQSQSSATLSADATAQTPSSSAQPLAISQENSGKRHQSRPPLPPLSSYARSVSNQSFATPNFWSTKQIIANGSRVIDLQDRGATIRGSEQTEWFDDLTGTNGERKH